MTIEGVAVFILEHGDLNTLYGDVRFQRLELLGREIGQKLVLGSAVRLYWGFSVASREHGFVLLRGAYHDRRRIRNPARDRHAVESDESSPASNSEFTESGFELLGRQDYAASLGDPGFLRDIERAMGRESETIQKRRTAMAARARQAVGA